MAASARGIGVFLVGERLGHDEDVQPMLAGIRVRADTQAFAVGCSGWSLVVWAHGISVGPAIGSATIRWLGDIRGVRSDGWAVGADCIGVLLAGECLGSLIAGGVTRAGRLTASLLGEAVIAVDRSGWRVGIG